MSGGSIFGWRTLVGVGVTPGWRTDAGVLVRLWARWFLTEEDRTNGRSKLSGRKIPQALTPESLVMRKYPAGFGKGVTEKAREGPRRYPTSFGGGQTEKEQQCHLAGWLPYSKNQEGNKHTRTTSSPVW